MRVVLADDSLLLREGLARLLEEAGLEVVGQAATGAELLEQVEATQPDAHRNALNMPEIVTGSVSRSLALLAATMSDLTLARRHFDAALEMNASMTARPWHALTLKDRDPRTRAGRRGHVVEDPTPHNRMRAGAQRRSSFRAIL